MTILNFLKVNLFSQEKKNIILNNLDQPKFGEIVHEPPTLTLPKRSKFNKSTVNI